MLTFAENHLSLHFLMHRRVFQSEGDVKCWILCYITTSQEVKHFIFRQDLQKVREILTYGVLPYNLWLWKSFSLVLDDHIAGVEMDA